MECATLTQNLYRCMAVFVTQATFYQSDHPICHTYTHRDDTAHPHSTTEWLNWMNGWLLLLTQYSNVIVPQSFCCRLMILDVHGEWQQWQANRKISHNDEQQDDDDDIINNTNSNWITWRYYAVMYWTAIACHLPKIQHILFIFSFIFIRCYN